MIAFIKGILEAISESGCIVDANGVGYEISMPAGDLAKMPKVGEPVLIHTWHVQREDAQLLFGFLQASDRRLFKLLLSVASIGPKSALAVLSGLSQAQLEDAVHRQDTAMLSKVPGIGRKTAERLVLELKDKLEIRSDVLPAVSGMERDAFAEALEALIALGYSATQARNALQKALAQDVPASVSGSERVAEYIRRALKTI